MPQAPTNGIFVEYESHGPADAEPVLLIMGLGTQMTRWPAPLYGKLVDRGLRVIRFDNRDVGLSAKLDDAGPVDMTAVIGALMQGRKPEVPYLLSDMAADAVGLLDHLGIESAHVVGASMGGMIAQMIAAEHPARVLSLTSIMSSTGNPALPRATPEAMAVLTNRPPHPETDLEGYLDHSVRAARVLGSPGYPMTEEALRERSLHDVRRSHYPAGFQRQYAAIAASGDRREKLKNITAPTVVLHGADDPLVPLAAGQDTAASIPGAEMRVVPGMGHDVPPGLYDTIVDAIMAAVARARTRERAQ